MFNSDIFSLSDAISTYQDQQSENRLYGGRDFLYRCVLVLKIKNPSTLGTVMLFFGLFYLLSPLVAHFRRAVSIRICIEKQGYSQTKGWV